LLVDFRALTLAIAARAMFSIEDDRRPAELANLMNEGERQTSFLHWSDFLFLLLGRGIAQPSVRRAFGERWRGWMVSFLENRPPLAQLDEARDLLDLLRTARDQGGGGPFQAEVIVDQVGTMMAAGFETTAVALFWIALLLAFFPNQQEAARGELCAESVDAPPEAQFLRSLATTTAFVYEALRLYPPVYTFSRQAAVDDRIGDLSIPRGATITISPWLLHRHQRHWEHSHRFDPQRFLGDGRIVVPKAWMPFGAGPRVCIGMVFATTEIFTVLRILLARYRIALQGQAPQHADDARMAIDNGADVLYCTNHGGRQANSGISTLQLLPGIVEAAGSTPVMFDSGVRDATDAVIALALGATAVGIGRPYAYALSYGGTESLTHYLKSLLAEFDLTLAICGFKDIATLKQAGCEQALTFGR
jgi:cytochrome P450